MARASTSRLAFPRVSGFALATCLMLVAASAAAAPPVRLTGVARKADMLVVSVGLGDLFGPRDTERLLSGFTTRVLIRAALVQEGQEQSVTQAVRLSEIVYDLWDEKVRVRVSNDQLGKPVVQTVPDPKAAVDIATSLIDFPLADIAMLDANATYHVSFRADLNPISDTLVTNVRRWLSRPGSRAGSGQSFFGSFVSVFVNPRVEDSERMLSLVSQSFQIPRGSSP
jgi:hypothetical protein